MKELEQPVQDKALTATEIVAKKDNKKEIRLINTERKIRGHILWEFNEITRELNRVSYKKQTFTLTSLDPNKADYLKINDQVDIKENCYYFQALNYESAVKKLKKKGYEIAF